MTKLEKLTEIPADWGRYINNTLQQIKESYNTDMEGFYEKYFFKALLRIVPKYRVAPLIEEYFEMVNGLK